MSEHTHTHTHTYTHIHTHSHTHTHTQDTSKYTNTGRSCIFINISPFNTVPCSSEMKLHGVSKPQANTFTPQTPFPLGACVRARVRACGHIPSPPARTRVVTSTTITTLRHVLIPLISRCYRSSITETILEHVSAMSLNKL